MFFPNTNIFEDATYKSRKSVKCVALDLTHHELYKQIVVDPPCGVLFYGLSNTGKTMYLKAVANHTTTTFIRVVSQNLFKSTWTR
ncbi:26S protease regulatory subunit 6B -like protein [Capsicum chinense]|nr:26S protease regulatory subunit 6B -like protein [Capsicum chinense]